MDTTSNQIINNLIDSVKILTNSAMADAGYDKTIQGIIQECRDESLGYYKVRYQNSILDAYAIDPSIKYSKNTLVYVQIPQGNTRERKTILGSTSQLGTSYIDDEIENTEISDVSGNLLSSTESLTYPIPLYTDYPKTENGQEIKEYSQSIKDYFNISNHLQGYLKNSSHLKISMQVKTNLPLYQRAQGEYGLQIKAIIMNSVTQKESEETFWITNEDFVGSIYSYQNWSEQKVVKEINGIEIKSIQDIIVYTKNFPQSNNTRKKKKSMPTIFIQNISLNGGMLLDRTEKNSVSLNFLAPEGYVFGKIGQGESGKQDDKRNIQVVVKNKMSVVNPAIQGLGIYWFKRDLSARPGTDGFLIQGGVGWSCVNKRIQNDISNNDNEIKIKESDFISSEILTIDRSMLPLQRETTFKCVVEYNGRKYEKNFVIINQDSNYILELESSEGTFFEHSFGNPILTCTVTKEEPNWVFNPNDYNFMWHINNNQGQTEYLEEATAAQTSDYYQTKIAELKEEWQNNKFEWEQQATEDKTYKQLLQSYQKKFEQLSKTQYVYQNVLYHVDLKKVIEKSIFVCQVYLKGEKENEQQLIGSVSLELKNKNALTSGYELVINNGNQTFLYDQHGISLYGDSLENPYPIKELSFSLYRNGQEIEYNDIAFADIEWKIPCKDTLILYNPEPADKIKGDYYSALKYPQITFNVDRQYNVNKSNNDIILSINCNDSQTGNNFNISTSTTFSFVKQGGNGTNGSLYQLKINGENPLEEPSFSFYKGDDPTYYHDSQNLTLSVWKAGEQQNENIGNVEWKILENNGDSSSLNNNINIQNPKQVSIISQPQKININNSFFENAEKHNLILQNIVQAAVEIENKKQYATICIPTIYYNENRTKANYIIKLRKGSGFREVLYNKDGILPSYDQRLPFEINIYNKEGDEITNRKIQNSNGTFSSQFNFTWISVPKDTFGITNNENTCYVTPPSTYVNTNCTYNAIVVEIKEKGNIIGMVHIPIHFMVNRYSNPALNDWDGTSIKINESGNSYILSPQVGAGVKKNNAFTGIIMGTQQTGNDDRIGLLGYSAGQRSIFLDAKTGNATFGLSDKGQIEIDVQNQAIIRSGDYEKQTVNDEERNKYLKGMQIQFSGNPHIYFSSGNFMVDSQGKITARGGGSIAGWNIEDKTLSKGCVTINSDNSKSTNQAIKVTNGEKNIFSVDYRGYLHSEQGNIAGWTIEPNKLHNNNEVGMAFDNWWEEKKGKKYYTGVFWAGSPSGSFIELSSANFYERNFFVTKNGFLFSKKGNIGGWDIKSNELSYTTYYDKNKKKEKTSTGMTSQYTSETTNAFWAIKKDEENHIISQFIVDHQGNITANSGSIGNWNIGDGGLYHVPAKAKVNGKTKNFEYGDFVKETDDNIYVPGTKGCLYIGSDGISLGSKFHVDDNGRLYAIEGKIGGCNLNSSGISGDNWSIPPTGEAKFTNVEINGASVTNMMKASGKGGISGGGSSLGGGGFSTPGRAISASPNGKTTIDASQVIVPGGITLATYIEKLADEVVTKKVTADFVASKIAEVKWLRAKIVQADTFWVGDSYNVDDAIDQIWKAIDKLQQDKADKSEIPSSPTS